MGICIPSYCITHFSIPSVIYVLIHWLILCLINSMGFPPVVHLTLPYNRISTHQIILLGVITHPLKSLPFRTCMVDSSMPLLRTTVLYTLRQIVSDLAPNYSIMHMFVCVGNLLASKNHHLTYRSICLPCSDIRIRSTTKECTHTVKHIQHTNTHMRHKVKPYAQNGLL